MFIEGDDVRYSNNGYDDSHWQTVDLPHDWSIKAGFDQAYDGATAYLPGGVGWYRKTFDVQQSQRDKLFYLYFDGVYANSEVWVNGKKLGGRINGYSPFYIDITNALTVEKPNLIAVKVDHSRYIDSRWYTGSGIYRNVELRVTDPLNIPIWGTFVTTDKVSKDKADVSIEVEIDNRYSHIKQLELLTRITDAKGNQYRLVNKNISIDANSSDRFLQSTTIENPILWDIDSPHLYQAETELIVDGKTIASYHTRFGIRSFHFDSEHGFSLNGRSLKIKGVNLHHDAGLVGTAVPKKVWYRRLQRLKDAGVNAIRTAHNPASSEFLDLCDEMGFLVQAEIFDEWDNPKDKRLNQWERHSDDISRGYAEVFQLEAQADLKDAILRDRNHPSIIMWSIGNEIEWTYPRYKAATGYFDMNAKGNYFYNPPFISPEAINKRFHDSEEGKYVLAKTANKLSRWVKEVDTTRPVTANLILPSVSHISGYTDALDVIGYSYRRVIYDYGHRLFPGKPIMGSENVVQWHEWKAIEERDFIAGTFLWTGIDYLGEAHNAWPRKSTESGMLDTAGFTKPSYHMIKSLWSDKPHVYISSQVEEKSLYRSNADGDVVEREPGAWQQRVWIWQDVNRHWNYPNQAPVIVEVLSNCDSVELFVNKVSLGIQKQSDNPDRILKWFTPFEAGTIEAKGVGACQASDSITTSNNANQIQLSADTHGLSLVKDEIAHIEVQLLDSQSNPVRHQEHRIEFVVSSNLEIIGVDNGNSATMETYHSNQLTTHLGRALLIVRAKEGGISSVAVKAQGIQSNEITFNRQ
ncbi:beta-galactosidase [Paraferrimonas haliotis]|uniref:Beta-galactosidase n=2 Tax=Paraferrimonas haliotis TaxID=2013866 RepID=A0AA37TTV0_9GAMM|nr:beta-galactosidase [Paraferrimonas haliotis]